MCVLVSQPNHFATLSNHSVDSGINIIDSNRRQPESFVGYRIVVFIERIDSKACPVKQNPFETGNSVDPVLRQVVFAFFSR